MKTLFIFAHPDLSKSKASATVLKNIDEDYIDLHSLYHNYIFDLEVEHERLLKYDKIVFVSPIYWYAVTPMMQAYINDVLNWGFAYGADQLDYKIANKEVALIVSTGSHKDKYNPEKTEGSVSLETYLKNIEKTFEFVKMNYVGMYHIDNVRIATIEEIEANVLDILKKGKS